MVQRRIKGQGRAVGAAIVLLSMVVAACSADSATTGRAATQSAASAPASRPAGPVLYQPGVSIDWAAKEVLLAGEVVLRSGDLELFACSPGTKEHESIVRVQARPTHIFQALGLIGLESGHPAYFDNDQKTVIPAQGQRLEIAVRWRQDGQRRAVPIEQWLYDKARKAPAGPVGWVFAGSRATTDGQLLADLEGTVLCVVDFDGALIAAGASHSADNADLWLAANSEQIPPAGTPLTLIVRAARPRLVFAVDRFGRLRRDGQASSLREWVQAARDASQTGAGAVGVLQYDPGVSDMQVRALLAALRQTGLVEVTSAPLAPESQPAALAGSPRIDIEEQGLALVETLADLGRQLPSAIDVVARSVQSKYRRLNERATAAMQSAAGAARVFGSTPASLPSE